MAYELWETRTANLIGFYETEDEALASVRLEIDAHGAGYVASWVLSEEARRGRSRTVAAGADLAERARKAVAA
jgi:hypothetical protein